MEDKSVVDLHELGDFVLLETHEALQRRRLFSGAAHAMHDMTLFLLTNEENVEHFDLIEGIKPRPISKTDINKHTR